MTSEQKVVNRNFGKLKRSKLYSFPRSREILSAPMQRGVYVIYSPQQKVLHVGRTPRGLRGIYQRLTNHLHRQSSFTTESKYLKRHGRTLRARCKYLRKHCKYRCLVVEDERIRALLEAYAIGRLCPDHIGLHQFAG